MKIVVDMNLSPRWVAHLREAGFEADHWSSIGATNAADVEIMRYARDHDCIVLTHDLDFGAILSATGGGKPSVVQLRADDLSPESIGQRTVAAFHTLSEDLVRGALVTIDTVRIRLRLLPIS